MYKAEKLALLQKNDTPASPNKVCGVNKCNPPAGRYIHIAAAVFLAAGISGCSLSRTLTADTDPSLTTGSIAAPVDRKTLDSADALVITRVVAETENAGTPHSLALAWSNPDTGNRGTIMAIDRFADNNGQNCKRFRTTVDNYTGISVYDGEACQTDQGAWILSRFAKD
jgi:surface antigen